MCSPYQQSCQEFITALTEDIDALDKLQKMYKLPPVYSSLPAAATMDALEMLGVFSPDYPLGLIEISRLLGIKETSKKIKKILKHKKNYPQFRSLSYSDLHYCVNLQTMLKKIQSECQKVRGQIELMEMVIETKSSKQNMQTAADSCQDMKQKMEHLDQSLTEGIINVSNEDPPLAMRLPQAHIPPAIMRPFYPKSGSDPLKRKQKKMLDESIHPTKYTRAGSNKDKSPSLVERRNFERYPSPNSSVRKSRTFAWEKLHEREFEENPTGNMLSTIIANEAIRRRANGPQIGSHSPPIKKPSPIQPRTTRDHIVVSQKQNNHPSPSYLNFALQRKKQTDSSPNQFLKKQPPQVKPKPQKPKTPLLPPTSIHRSPKGHSDKIPSKRFSDGYVTMKPDVVINTQYTQQEEFQDEKDDFRMYENVGNWLHNPNMIIDSDSDTGDEYEIVNSSIDMSENQVIEEYDTFPILRTQ